MAQGLIGHDSEAMHELYLSVGREALEKAAVLCLRSESTVGCVKFWQAFGGGKNVNVSSLLFSSH